MFNKLVMVSSLFCFSIAAHAGLPSEDSDVHLVQTEFFNSVEPSAEDLLAGRSWLCSQLNATTSGESFPNVYISFVRSGASIFLHGHQLSFVQEGVVTADTINHYAVRLVLRKSSIRPFVLIYESSGFPADRLGASAERSKVSAGYYAAVYGECSLVK